MRTEQAKPSYSSGRLDHPSYTTGNDVLAPYYVPAHE